MAQRAAVLGVGQTRFKKQPEVAVEALAHEAVRAAAADAGIALDDIDAAFVGSVTMHGGVGQRCLKEIGLTRIPIVNVENACSSGSTAVREAYAWVAAGLADVAVAVGVDSLSTAMPSGVQLDLDDPNGMGMGLVLPGTYALEATHYMHEYGATAEHLAAIAVKNRGNAAMNPLAHFQKPVTLDEVLASKMICEPLTMFECCSNTDGAAAAIIATPEAARRLGHPGGVWIVASAMGSGTFNDHPAQLDRATPRVAAKAYEAAGIGPDDVDLVELHDSFAIAEWVYIEELGLAEEGKAWAQAAEGAFEIGGRVAVSPGGGLIGRGHPMGPTGVAQLCEATWQLRGTAGARQVPDAKVAVTHTMGGNQFEMEANACIVNVLAR
ncbi:MAG: thiolase family protein [Acidimicrobiales bacterium]|nr:thiolase family protein [Acidimicrobiales bacterium]